MYIIRHALFVMAEYHKSLNNKKLFLSLWKEMGADYERQ